MLICQVRGPVVSTSKHPCYRGLKLLIVEPLDENSVPSGESFLAVDRLSSGPGDRVLVMQEGGSVRKLFGEEKLPIRSIIVGFVDHMEIG